MRPGGKKSQKSRISGGGTAHTTADTESNERRFLQIMKRKNRRIRNTAAWLAAMLAAVLLTVPAMAQGNLGDTSPTGDGDWIGMEDGVIEGDSGASGGIMDGIMDSAEDMIDGNGGTGTSGGTGTPGGTSGGTSGGIMDDMTEDGMGTSGGTGTGGEATDTAGSSSGEDDGGTSVFWVVLAIILIVAAGALIIAVIPKKDAR